MSPWGRARDGWNPSPHDIAPKILDCALLGKARKVAQSALDQSPAAGVEILQDVIDHHPQRNGDYLFSGTDGEKGLQGWSHAHERMMKAIVAVSGERNSAPWTPHDLRRTVATRIAEQLGIGGEQIISGCSDTQTVA